jgi:branched-chain amino acid transport system ATP-binding protein
LTRNHKGTAAVPLVEDTDDEERRHGVDPSTANEADAVLTAQELSVSYGRQQALVSFSFACKPKAVTAIIGPNGSGKTSTLNAITGLVSSGGQVWLGTKNITGLGPRVVFSCGLARTFQNLDLIDDRSVLDNVMLGARSAKISKAPESNAPSPKPRSGRRERREQAMRAIEQLALADIALERAGELSYGARRRVEVARALAGLPCLLLLDEPTAGMGPAESVDFGELLVSLASQLDIALLIIEHDMSVVRAAASDVYVLASGECIAHGHPAEVLQSETVRSVYLGDLGER